MLTKLRLETLGLLAPFTLLACTGGDAGSAPDGAGGQNDGEALSLVLDPTSAEEAAIGYDGGTLSATAGDGTVFTLTVPEAALPSTTMIRAIPTRITSFAFASQTVTFEPSGLFFYDLAQLSIDAPEPIPAEERFFYHITGGGTEVSAALPVFAEETPTVYVAHFSAFSVAAPSEGEQAELALKGAADAEASIESEVDAVAEDGHRRSLLGDDISDVVDALTALLDRWQHEVVEPRVEQAGSSCAATQAAVETALRYETVRQHLAFPASDLASTAVNGALTEGSLCEMEAIRKCQSAHDPGILITYVLSRERLRQLLAYPPSASLTSLRERAEAVCVQAFSASGGNDGIMISGTVDDLKKPFTLDGVIDGGSMVLSYVPDADGRSGTFTESGSAGGFSLTGDGTYLITGEDGGPLTLTEEGNGCVDTFCSSHSEDITLTPLGG